MHSVHHLVRMDMAPRLTKRCSELGKRSESLILCLVRPMRVLTFIFLPMLIITCAAADDTTQTLRGKPLACELDVPASWEVASNEGYRILALGDGAGLMLGSLQQNLGDPSATLKEAKGMATKDDPNAKFTEPVSITIDGRKWLQFMTTTNGVGGAMTFLTYTYSGPEGTFVVIGYTTSDQFETKRALLTRYMSTFRFPKKA